MDDLTPEKAIDGRMDTRWSGIPGHNEGVWYQLEWKEPVEVGEVVIHQFDTFAMEWNVQVLDAKTSEWRTVQHFGKPGVQLPLVVTCRFAPCKVTGVRIADITNGPSFNEVEVYSRPFARGLATRRGVRFAGAFHRHRVGRRRGVAGRRGRGDALGQVAGRPVEEHREERRQRAVHRRHAAATCRAGHHSHGAEDAAIGSCPERVAGGRRGLRVLPDAA